MYVHFNNFVPFVSIFSLQPLYQVSKGRQTTAVLKHREPLQLVFSIVTLHDGRKIDCAFAIGAIRSVSHQRQ